HDGPNPGNLEWRPPSRGTLSFILHHPLYAGAYIYGRERLRGGSRSALPVTDPAGRPGAGGVLIWDRCPAYITRERFERNQRQLADNRTCQGARGVPRGGAALLPGLLYCGRCGARLTVSYPGPTRPPEYVCAYRWKMYGESICQWISGKVL